MMADTPELLGCLSAMLDEFTRSELRAAGLTAGMRCLELGAGAGTVSAWMADQGASVVAVDIQPRHVKPHDRVRVVQGDVVRQALPAGQFDLIVARLLLGWLPERQHVFEAAVNRLAPGGALVIIEAESRRGQTLLTPRDAESVAILEQYDRVVRRMIRSQGHDLTWCQRVHPAMVEAGLRRVRTRTHSASWNAGTAGTILSIVSSAIGRIQLVEAGMPAARIDRMHEFLSHPDTVVQGVPVWATTGFRLRGAAEHHGDTSLSISDD